MTAAPIPAEILAIGDEIVQGWKVDTNSSEIARALLTRGAAVERVTAVGDRREAIAAAFRGAASRARIVVATGGLGPTDDDVTREGAADALGVALEFIPELWDAITARLRARGRPIPESNRRQAERPAGARSIPNANGTAPGFAFDLAGARVYALPGVPAEMRAMLEGTVLAEVAPTAGAAPLGRAVVKAFGASEAQVGELIQPFMARGADPLVGITVSRGMHTISVVSADPVRVEGAAARIRAVLGDLVYSDRDETLEEAVARALLERGSTIALAESCTGGLLTALLTGVPGISAVLREGFVTYANEAKTARLGVPADLLRSQGAVSAACAAAMAEGARRAAATDFALSTTGIAGPSGGSPEKPVGLVWIGLASKEGVQTYQANFAGLERNLLRELAAREALNRLRLAFLRPIDP